MIWQNYRIGDEVSILAGGMRLWQAEKGIIEVSEGTLAVGIDLEGRRRGYIFHGSGKLLLDTIVETEEGALGKSIEKELNDPFLMLGNTEEAEKHLARATEKDLANMGYTDQQGFNSEAEELCHKFFKGNRHTHNVFRENHGVMFAFKNEAQKLDIIAAKGSKLIYKGTNMVFMAKGSKVMLKNPHGIICAGNGKSVIITKFNSHL